jgi:Lar family restriction alleviation protein
MSELRPCPFCGAGKLQKVLENEDTVLSLSHNSTYQVICMAGNCGSVGPWRWTEAQAIAAWNRREPDWQAKWEGLVEVTASRTDQAAADDKLAKAEARIEELEADLEAIQDNPVD